MLYRHYVIRILFIMAILLLLPESTFASNLSQIENKVHDTTSFVFFHKILQIFVKVISSEWIYWLSTIAATFTYGWALSKLGNKPEHCETFARQIKQGRLTQGYYVALKSILNNFDSYLNRKSAKPSEAGTLASRSWNKGLLDFTLAFSIAYPFLSLLIQWTITGNAGKLGSLEIISGNTYWLTRLLIFFATGLSVLLIVLNLDENQKKKNVSGSLKKSTFAVFAMLFASGAFLFTSIETVVLSGFIVAIIFAYLVSGAAAITIALIIAIGPNFPIAAIAIVLFFIQDLVGKFTGRPTLILFIYVIFLYVLLAVAVKINIVNGTQIKLLIMIGFLPILNALFDFLSIGFTRYQLRKALETGNFIIHGIIDLVFGVLLFIALAFAILIGYSILQTPDGGQLLNISEILRDVRVRPEHYSWLYITFASTLLPTFLHVILIVTTWLFDIIPRYKDWLAYWVLKAGDPESRGLNYVVPAGFGLIGYIAVAIPLSFFYIIYLIIVAFGLDIGSVLFTGIETLAHLLGTTE